jgi:hypothetical protein
MLPIHDILSAVILALLEQMECRHLCLHSEYFLIMMIIMIMMNSFKYLSDAWV